MLKVAKKCVALHVPHVFSYLLAMYEKVYPLKCVHAVTVHTLRKKSSTSSCTQRELQLDLYAEQYFHPLSPVFVLIQFLQFFTVVEGTVARLFSVTSRPVTCRLDVESSKKVRCSARFSCVLLFISIVRESLLFEMCARSYGAQFLQEVQHFIMHST